MMTAESRDFNVATYSEASFTGTARASITLTGMAGGPAAPCGVGAVFLEHASVAAIPINPRLSKAFDTIC
jgi:hypothetical protein